MKIAILGTGSVGQAITGMMKPQKQIERTVDLGNQVEYIYTDGTRETQPKGATPRDPSTGTGSLKQYTDKRTGEVVFLTNADAQAAAKEGWLAPGPTSEMRNTSFQAGAVEPAFDLVSQSLDNFEREQGGTGMLTQMIPGSKAWYAKDHYTAQVKALLGAIVARQAGEGSRLSDEDRVAYSRAAGLVNSALMLPGGAAEARTRLEEARKLINDIQQKRAISGASSGAFSTAPAPTTGPLPAETQSALDRLFGPKQ